MRFVVALVTLVCSSCSASSDWRADVRAWKAGDPLPKSLPLLDENARPFHLGDVAGEPLAIGFVFTNCAVSDACPMTMARLVDAQKLAEESHARIRFLVVTIDPVRDTPAVLSEYARKFKVDTNASANAFTLATGDKDAIDALASLFNVVAVKQGNTIAHPVKTAVVDDKLRVKRVFSDNNFLAKELIDAAAAQ